MQNLKFNKHWFSVLENKKMTKVVQNVEEFLEYRDQKTVGDRGTRRMDCDPNELRRGLL